MISDYGKPIDIDWFNLPSEYQDGEEEIARWSLPLEVWDPSHPDSYWYRSSDNKHIYLREFNGRDTLIELRNGYHPSPRVRNSALRPELGPYRNSFFLVWERDK